MKRYNCNQGSECDNMHGVFNCSLGHCGNYSERFLCHYKADGVILNTEKDNMKLNGFFECRKSFCTKIKRPFRYRLDYIFFLGGNVSGDLTYEMGLK